MMSSKQDKDCLPCRIVSGAGMLGISSYLAVHAKRNQTIPGKILIYSIATGFGGVGVARLLNTYPFDKKARAT